MKSGLKRADASAPPPPNSSAPGSKGVNNAAMDGTNLYGDSNGGAASDGGHSFQSKIAMLERDIERRQESYISRERAYKMRIDELEEELNNQRQAKTGWMKTDPKISKLKAMQNQILHNVELVQNRTAAIMQEQERDLLRSFRARLFDVQTELEKEKSKKDDGAIAWIEKCRQLESEVEWAKEVADRLERVNQSLLQENSRLKSQFTSQEEDRNFLIKQLVAVKKDNARLRAEYTEMEADYENCKKQLSELDELRVNLIAAPAGKNQANNMTVQQKIESEEKYKDINGRLRKLLAEERKSLLQVRQNYAAELKVRTDMELLLRKCVEDVREEIARRHVENAQFAASTGQAELARLYSKQPNLIPVDEFTQEDRERALELLLSQERVVSLIYAKTFPVVQTNNNPSLTLTGGGSHHIHHPSSGGGGSGGGLGLGLASSSHHRSVAELQSFADMSFDHEADELLNRGNSAIPTSSYEVAAGGPNAHGAGGSAAGSAKLPLLNPQATQGGASGGPPRKIISR